jgi:hypothetical protein
MIPNPRSLFVVAVATLQPNGGKVPYPDLNQMLANSPFGACKNHLGLGRVISSAWRLANSQFGPDVADKVAETFVGKNGKPPWQK